MPTDHVPASKPHQTRETRHREGSQSEPFVQGSLDSERIELSATPSSLRPQDILTLQRTIGNRAVSALVTRSAQAATVQRRLIEASEFRKKTSADDLNLVNIANEVEKYNKALDDVKTPPEQLFKLLRGVDKAVYAWFAEATRRHKRLEQAPHHAAVEALRVQSEKEHSELIKRHQNTLPFSIEGLQAAEVGKLAALWNEIQQGISKIKLVSNPVQREKTLADIAKLLNTPTGRQILIHLNDPKELLTYIGQSKSQLPPEAREKLQTPSEESGSFAVPLAGKESGSRSRMDGPFPVDANARESGDFLEANSTADFRRAALQGKRGVIFQDQLFVFSQGAGAYVQFSAEQEPMHNAEGNELLSPDFIKLGHELGHAAGIRSGAGGVGSPHDADKKQQDWKLMSQLSGMSEDEAMVEWDTSEELINVQSVENPLRAESGASEKRGFYGNRDLVVRRRRERELNLTPLIKTYRKKDPVVEYMEAFQKLEKMSRQILDDSVYQEAKLYVKTIPEILSDAAIAKFKRDTLMRHYQIIKAAYEPLQPKPADLVKEFARVSSEVLYRTDAYIQSTPDTPFFILNDRLKALRTQLGVPA